LGDCQPRESHGGEFDIDLLSSSHLRPMAATGLEAPRYALAMESGSSVIVQCLDQVRRMRALRSADVGLAARVDNVKRFQHRRFERDYADLLASARYGAAARFFLEDLYGPFDFSARDAQFSRIVPALQRALPAELLRVVGQLVGLHALSEELDQLMAQQIGDEPLDEAAYAEAWRRVDRRADRLAQVELMLAIGHALDHHTRRPLLGTTLRLMHGPAHAVGLGDLQEFLQRGFLAFRSMRGAQDFLQRIAQNERALIERLFAA
jgi:hypothetical protein